jgi:hypothetical protein
MTIRMTKAGTGGEVAVRVLALAATMWGTLGCGAELSEPVGQVKEALGSTQNQETIGDWDGLTRMVEGGNYLLTANINASGRTWTPKDFSGTFDGGNRTISNLTINVPTWYVGGFFAGLTNAIVRNVRFVNLRINGGQFVGGIAGSSWDSLVENCAVEVTIAGNGSAGDVGGVFGEMSGGKIYRTYTKGSITGRWANAGGIAGEMWRGAERASIENSYAQMTISPDTPGSITVTAGGIVGYALEPNVFDVYAVGNVTGRGAVGGLVGNLDCIPDEGPSLFYKGIYRGDVIDRNMTPSGGWAGTLGIARDCAGNRVTMLHWDSSLDQSRYSLNFGLAQLGSSTTDLRLPTTPIGGVFCAPDYADPERCGDNAFADPPWNAGSSSQHHVLRNMPGPNIQLR